MTGCGGDSKCVYYLLLGGESDNKCGCCQFVMVTTIVVVTEMCHFTGVNLSNEK